jgi:hypothetical protein
VIVGDQGSLDWCAGGPVVPDDGVEREQPLDYAGPQPGGDAAAVALRFELAIEGPDDGLASIWRACSRSPASFGPARTQCGSSRPGGTGLGRALNTGS